MVANAAMGQDRTSEARCSTPSGLGTPSKVWTRSIPANILRPAGQSNEDREATMAGLGDRVRAPKGSAARGDVSLHKPASAKRDPKCAPIASVRHGSRRENFHHSGRPIKGHDGYGERGCWA